MTREISRQAFVRGALGGVVAGALLGSCRSTAPEPPASPSAASPSPPATVSGPQDWSALEEAIDGRVVLPSSPDYAAAKSVFNARFDDSTPAAVVVAKSVGDVQRAVEFAARNDVTIAARSGGHSYIGASTAASAMVIDLRQLAGEITYDDGSELATISAAAQLDSVQTALAAHGRSVPSGSCPTVGVAGLTLGGGLGSDARRSGLTCDALVSAAVVLPSGEAITASADDHADLFWALRGGGGGSFGVVTSFTFRTLPIADRDVVTLVFPEGRRSRRSSAGTTGCTMPTARSGAWSTSPWVRTLAAAPSCWRRRLATGARERATSAPWLVCGLSTARAEPSVAWISSTTSKAALRQHGRVHSSRVPTSSGR